jgi:hypothetical protein
MGDLHGTRQKFILAAVVLSVINVALLVYLFWGGSGGPTLSALQKQAKDLQDEVTRWEKNNPEKTRADLKQFYAENIPVRDSQISEQVEKLTRDTGVSAPAIQYPVGNEEKNSLPDVRQIKVETNVTGDYEKVARFINALEQDKMLFIIEKISLSGQQGGVVSLQISFNTFLRESAPSFTPPTTQQRTQKQ